MQRYTIKPQYKDSLEQFYLVSKVIDECYYYVERRSKWHYGEFALYRDETCNRFDIDLPDDSSPRIVLSHYDYDILGLYDKYEETFYIYDSCGIRLKNGPIYDNIMSIVHFNFCDLEEKHGWSLQKNDFIIYHGCKLQKTSY